MSNHEMSKGPLLDKNGNIIEPGFAYSLVKKYDRKAIKASKMRIKEWDYYYVGNNDFGVALTVADNGYMSLSSVTVLEFNPIKLEIAKSVLGLFPLGKLHLPNDSSFGDTTFKSKKGDSFVFKHEGKNRRLVCEIPDFGMKGRWFRCDILLKETVGKTMVIATPFKKKGRFYYNQKINNLQASGYFKVGDKMYDLGSNSFGVLDWGRGVWTYKNTWYWASCQGKVGEHIVGFNLGYGFGDTSAASENMLFVDKTAYKLNDVKFDIPLGKNGKDDFMGDWNFRSLGGEINLKFHPLYNRHYDGKLVVIRSNQNQVFGIYNGYFLIDGEKIIVENLLGFAEKVYNRW